MTAVLGSCQKDIQKDTQLCYPANLNASAMSAAMTPSLKEFKKASASPGEGEDQYALDTTSQKPTVVAAAMTSLMAKAPNDRDTVLAA